MMPYVFLLFALLGLAAAAGPVDTNCTAPDGADVKVPSSSQVSVPYSDYESKY